MRLIKCPTSVTLVCYLLFFCTTIAHAQTNQSTIKLPDYVPASPNAAELGRYGNYDIGYQTGSMNVQVPLFSLQGDKVPISLNYATGGIRVNQIASRVGMGFVLQAGGVITRSVKGKPDEMSTRVFPNVDVLDQTLYNVLQSVVSSSGGSDTEPDEFMYSFGGYNGKFVIDNNGDPLLIPHNNLKVQYLGSTIVITAPDGTVYNFAAMERTATSSVTYGDGVGPTSMLIPTSWYISQIQLPNTETISFTYSDIVFFNETGTSEVIGRSDELAYNPCEACPDLNFDYLTLHSSQTFSKLLTEISFRSSKITFSYIDRLDVPGDKLISSIKLLNNNQQVKEAVLSYAVAESQETPNENFVQLTHLKYRPFLNSVIEKGADGIEVRRHSFEYNDINGLPWRLSFSQDHFGFFNNKFNLNTVPVNEEAEMQELLPAAKANKSIDPNFAVKGSLTKVVYPTGGSLEIEYESNTFRMPKILPPPEAIATVSITGPAYSGQTATSPVFTIPADAPIRTSNFFGGVLVQLGQPGDPVPVDETADLLLMEVREYPSDVFAFSHVFKLGDNLDVSNYDLTRGHSYYIRITVMNADDDIRRYSASVKYVSGPEQEVMVNELTGGMRIAKAINKDGFGNTEIKRLYYAALDHPDISSGFSALPVYHQVVQDIYNGNCNQMVVYCRSFTGHSDALANIYRYGQNHVYYSNVVESIGGDNFEGGGISHVFHVQKDGFSHPRLAIGASVIPGVRYSNTGYLNGVELSQLFFRKNGNTIIKAREIQNTYTVDTRINSSINTLYVSKRFQYPLMHNPFNPAQLSGFEVQTYTVNSRWSYKSQSSVIEYDPYGNPLTTTTQNYTFASPQHTQVTAETVVNSKGESLEKRYWYPHEMVAGSEDPSGVYAQMINRNMIAPAIKKIDLNNGVQTGYSLNEYQTITGSLIVPQLIKMQTLQSTPLEPRIIFNEYDAKANITSLSQTQGALISYVYDYDQSLPIAKVTNAAVADIAFTSFEASGGGNWLFSPQGLTEGGIAGRYAYNIATGISRAGLTPATTYRVSYWSNNGVQTVTGSTSYLTGASIGGWQYFEHTVQGATGVSVNGAGAIDELRLYPVQAHMVTYTYDVLFGITSQSDENNKITYFKYDAFGRLHLVRDQDGRILKKICYNYAGQPTTACAETGMIYAKLTLENEVTESSPFPDYYTRDRADLRVSFYFDAACTLSASVTNLPLDILTVVTPLLLNSNVSSYEFTNSYTCNGSSFVLPGVLTRYYPLSLRNAYTQNYQIVNPVGFTVVQ